MTIDLESMTDEELTELQAAIPTVQKKREDAAARRSNLKSCNSPRNAARPPGGLILGAEGLALFSSRLPADPQVRDAAKDLREAALDSFANLSDVTGRCQPLRVSRVSL